MLLVTKNPHEEPLLEPNVKYVANMHGNEVNHKHIILFSQSFDLLLGSRQRTDVTIDRILNQ